MTDTPGWATMTEGETVVWRGHPVVYHYLPGLLLSAGLLALGAWTLVSWPWPDLVAAWLPAASIAALGALVGLDRLVSRWTVQYLVTSEEVYVRRGLVSRSVTSLRLDRVQNSSFSQSLTGRLLSYGDVELDTAGGDGTEVVLENVPAPETVLGYVSQGMSNPRGPPIGVTAGGPATDS